MKIKKYLILVFWVCSTHVIHGQPIISNDFSAYQRKSIHSILQENFAKQVPIFADSYRLSIPTNTSRVLKITKSFEAICSEANIVFSSSDPAVFSISTFQQKVLVTANATGIEANHTAIITARCGSYYDAISLKVGG